MVKAPSGKSSNFFRGLLSLASFLTVAIALNILAIPVYLVLLLFPPLFPVAFCGINGYLLCREYFELAAHRHMDPANAWPCATKIVGVYGRTGAGIAFLFTVPFVNLDAPVIAVAAMVHVFKFITEPDGGLG